MKTTSHKYTESESSVHFPPNVLTGKKSSLRFKNEEEKTKTFLKTIVLESNPSLMIANDVLSLTITSELLKRKYIFCL